MARKRLPVKKSMCATCPFRRGGWEHIRTLLEERAMTEASPICHSSGRNALVKNHDPAQICRGARTYQATIFHRLGVIAAPTDAAWDAACEALGI